MSYTIDKKVIWTKNKFETFVNTLTVNEFNENLKTIDEEVRKNIIAHENKGSFLRKKHKPEFDRLYMCWLNTK